MRREPLTPARRCLTRPFQGWAVSSGWGDSQRPRRGKARAMDGTPGFRSLRTVRHEPARGTVQKLDARRPFGEIRAVPPLYLKRRSPLALNPPAWNPFLAFLSNSVQLFGKKGVRPACFLDSRLVQRPRASAPPSRILMMKALHFSTVPWIRITAWPSCDPKTITWSAPPRTTRFGLSVAKIIWRSALAFRSILALISKM